MHDEIRPLLNKRETARALNLSARTVDYLVTRGRLPCVKIGTAVRFYPADVQAFIQSLRKPAKP